MNGLLMGPEASVGLLTITAWSCGPGGRLYHRQMSEDGAVAKTTRRAGLKSTIHSYPFIWMLTTTECVYCTNLKLGDKKDINHEMQPWWITHLVDDVAGISLMSYLIHGSTSLKKEKVFLCRLFLVAFSLNFKYVVNSECRNKVTLSVKFIQPPWDQSSQSDSFLFCPLWNRISGLSKGDDWIKITASISGYF